MFTSSVSTGGRDAKTIISPNNSFGDIMTVTGPYYTFVGGAGGGGGGRGIQ